MPMALSDSEDFALSLAALKRAAQERAAAKHYESCPIHGLWESDPSSPTPCPSCTKRNFEVSWRMAASGIPPRYRDASLDNYQVSGDGQAKVLASLRDYVSTFDEVLETGRSLILSGRPGTGKTHLATALVRDLINSGLYTARYVTAMDLIHAIRSTWGREGYEHPTVVQQYVTPDLLVLDEVGVQAGSANEQQLWFEVINGRYEQYKPTLVASNLVIVDLEKVMGGRIIDRLRDYGGKALVFDWQSYRR